MDGDLRETPNPVGEEDDEDEPDMVAAVVLDGLHRLDPSNVSMDGGAMAGLPTLESEQSTNAQSRIVMGRFTVTIVLRYNRSSRVSQSFIG
jgi:hypothetical protein